MLYQPSQQPDSWPSSSPTVQPSMEPSYPLADDTWFVHDGKNIEINKNLDYVDKSNVDNSNRQLKLARVCVGQTFVRSISKITSVSSQNSNQSSNEEVISYSDSADSSVGDVSLKNVCLCAFRCVFSCRYVFTCRYVYVHIDQH